MVAIKNKTKKGEIMEKISKRQVTAKEIKENLFFAHSHHEIEEMEKVGGWNFFIKEKTYKDGGKAYKQGGVEAVKGSFKAALCCLVSSRKDVPSRWREI